MPRRDPPSEKQLAANRRNAQLPTGPRTPEGKALIPEPLALYESLAEFERLHEALRRELQPDGTIEELLVESIATSYWRLARAYRAEAGAIAEAQEQVHGLMEGRSRRKALFADSSSLNGSYRNPIADAASVESKRLSLALSDPHWESASDEQVEKAFESSSSTWRIGWTRSTREKKPSSACNAASPIWSRPSSPRVTRPTWNE